MLSPSPLHRRDLAPNLDALGRCCETDLAIETRKHSTEPASVRIAISHQEAAGEAASFESNNATLLQRGELVKRLKVAQQERDYVGAEWGSLRNQRDQKQVQAAKEVETSKEASLQLSSSSDLSKTYTSFYNETVSERIADKREVEEMQAELDELRRTLDHKKQIFRSELKNAYHAKEKEIDEARAKMLSDHHAAKSKLEQLHAEVGRLQSTLDQERQASMIELATLESMSTTMETVPKRAQDKSNDVFDIRRIHLEPEKRQQRKSAARNQEALRDLVTAVAASQSSYDKLFRASGNKGRIIHDLTSKVQRLEQQLTGIQDGLATQRSESTRLRKELCGKEEELKKLHEKNEANVNALDEIQLIHTACEHDKRLQLGRTNRDTFFDDFSEFAGSLSNKGIVFKGQECGRDIDVCFCILPENNEALCLVRRLDGAFTMWYCKLEDCSIFDIDFHLYVCFGREDQCRTDYIRAADTDEAYVFFVRNLSMRKASDTEVERFGPPGLRVIKK